MRRFIRDIKKYFRYIIYAGQSELKAEVANSYLNWLWWIIEPVCFMLIYSLVFGVFFHSKINHFNTFVYAGITLWTFFNHMITSSVKLVRSNKAIVSKVYIPKFVLILVKMYVNTFKMMISFFILIALVIYNQITPSWNMLWIIPIILVLQVFTFSFCTLLLHFGVYVDDLANVTSIFLRMMFYLTGVFYELDRRVGKAMGDKVSRLIMHVNPMANIITSARKAIMYGQRPELKFLALWLLIGVVVSAIGIHLIYKNENNYVKVI